MTAVDLDAVEGRTEPVRWDAINRIGAELHRLTDWEVHLVTLLTLEMLANRRHARWALGA